MHTRALGSRQYRRDVDGLRAVAVLFVLFFHLNFSLSSGGFVGVDIFYVISGFVIFRHIQEVSTYDTSFVFSFYLRRARRILPALLVTVSACLLIGYVVLTPTEYVATARSSIAAIFSVSNIYFAATFSYFAGDARTLPLLHTWSLGVEEQFYLTLPWVLVLLAILRRTKKLFSLVAAITFASFVYNILSSYFIFDEIHAFYMPMSRFWEIGVGALISFFEKTHRPSPETSRLFSCCGALGLLVSLCFLDSRMAFPGVAAVLPVGSTALLIMAQSGDGSLQTRILGAAPVQFLGRISYSLYLHHWPIIVFLGLILGREFHAYEKLLVLGATVLTAYASWRYVERPFRNAAEVSPKTLMATATAFVPLVLIGAVAINLTKGAVGRLNEKALSMHAKHLNRKTSENQMINCQRYAGFPKIKRSTACAVGPVKNPADYVLWGDSHAVMYAKALHAEFAREGYSGFSATMANCPPLLSVHFSQRKNKGDCSQLGDAVLDWAKNGKMKTLIIAGRWASVASKQRSPAEGDLARKIYRNANNVEISFQEAIDATIKKFTQMGIKVLVIGPAPEAPFDVPNSLVRSLQLETNLPNVPREEFDERQAIVFSALERISSNKDVSIFYPHHFLCSEISCAVHENNIPLYLDDDHLSLHSVQQLMPLITEKYERLVSTEGLADTGP